MGEGLDSGAFSKVGRNARSVAQNEKKLYYINYNFLME